MPESPATPFSVLALVLPGGSTRMMRFVPAGMVTVLFPVLRARFVGTLPVGVVFVSGSCGGTYVSEKPGPVTVTLRARELPGNTGVVIVLGLPYRRWSLAPCAT